MTALTRGAGRLIRGLTATTFTLLLLAGIPYGLSKFIGWPLPDHIPESTAELSDWITRAADDQFLLNALAVGLWLAWARFAYWFLIAVIDAARQGPRHLAEIDWRSAPIKGAAAILVGAIAGALLFDLARAIATGTPATAGPPAARPAIIATTVERTAVTAQAAGLPGRATPAAAVSATTAGAQDTYTVCQGDSLWSIAADHLGDPKQWRDIWVLNRHHTFDDGRTFTQPDIIQPGWTLQLPTLTSADTSPATPAPHQPTQAYLDRHAHDGDESPVPAPTPHLPGTDGVITPSAPAGGSQTPNAQATAESHSDTDSTGISLPSGSWISLGLAAALALAARLVWVQRRRLYQPKPPSATPRLTDPDAAALPGVVRQVQRSLTATSTTVSAAAAADSLGQTAAPAFAWPARDWAGMPATGTAGAARAVLIQALAAGAHDLDERGHVVIPAATLAALLPGTSPQALPPNPRMIVTSDLAAALDWCEEQLLHRRRILISHDVEDADALRDSDPLAEPMPLITLITEAPAGTEHVRATAILTQGRRVNITAAMLATQSEGAHDDGTAPPPAAGSLSAGEAVAMLHTVTESQTGYRLEPGEPAAADDENTDLLGESAAMAPELHQGEPAAGAADDDSGSDTDLDDADEQIADDEILPDGEEEAALPPVRVRITVLGGVTIHNPGNRKVDPPIRIPSVELVAYLIANGGEARQTAILEDILPDAPARRARGRLDTLVYSLRRGLGQIGGEQLYLDHPKHRYVLNPDALDVDVWHIRDLLARAEKSGSHDERIRALREAIALYVAPFAGDLPYEWKDRYVYAFSRQILDARVALAEALEHSAPDEALDAVLAAVAQDPKAEAPVRLAMTMYARLGNADAIRDLRRAIIRVLEDDGLEPSDELHAHAEQLLIQAGKKRPVRTR